MNSSLVTSKPFVGALVDIINFGISSDQLENVEAVIAAFRILRPRHVAIETFEAWIAVRRGRLDEAIRILSVLDASEPQMEHSKALLAFCRFATGDPGWRVLAHEILASNTSLHAVGLVRMLMNQANGTYDDQEEDPDEAAASPTAGLRLASDPSSLRV